jgi:PAS domain S-box-containing protein
MTTPAHPSGAEASSTALLEIERLSRREKELEAEIARLRVDAVTASDVRSHYRAICESAVDFAIIATNQDGRVIEWNAGAEHILGWSAAEMRGEHIDRIFTDEDRAEGRAGLEMRRAVAEGRANDERWHVRKTGVRFWATGEMMPLVSENDAHIGFIKILRDRTAEHEAAIALREETRRLETLNRTGATIAAGLDLEHVVQGVTDAGVEMTGARFGAFFYNVLNEAGESYMLYSLSGADRSSFDGFPMPRATELFQPTFRGEGVLRSEDILADPRYGRSAPHYGMPHGHLPVRSYLAVPVISRSGEVLGCLLFGHPKPGQFGEQTERLMLGIAAQAAVAIDNARLYQTAQREIEDRRRAEGRLVELTQTLEARVAERTAERDRTWRLSQDLLAVVETDGVIASVNRAFKELLGWDAEELIGIRFLEITHPDEIDVTFAVFQGIFEAPLVNPYQFRLRHRDGTYRWFAWTGAFEDGRVYANGRHTTAEHEQAEALARAEEQLRQSQKMEAVGQLTGGLAHDFNNLLAGISGSLELLQTRMTQGRLTELDRYIGAAQGAAKRAAALTHRLLAFSRRQTLDPKATNLNRLVGGMEELIRRTMGPSVEIEVAAAAGLWMTLIDPGQLENALLNLCINARDAMPDGGRLTIETAKLELDNQAAREHELSPGQYVLLSVADTGTGMSNDVIKRAFDPFFTTKPIGMGTGLGLSMVYGFARQSGGQMGICSEVGHGTKMCLYLPRHHGEEDGTETPNSLARTERVEQGKTVLVVDDEPTVRMLVIEVLEDLGYVAIEAGDGAAGLRALRSDVRIDLLITDVGLPGGMNGRQVADAGREVRPGLKVLFITGYAENVAVGDGNLGPGMQVLTKPFIIEALASRIQELTQSA